MTKRSYRHLFVGALGVGLLLSNCTVKEDSDESCEKGDKVNGCACPGSVKGHQVCGSDGVFGSCVCPDGAAGSGNTSGSNAGGGGSEGGGPGAGGAPESGAAGASAEAGAGGAPEGSVGGEGGQGGEAPFAFVDCDECLETLCAEQWDACLTADDDGLCIEQYADVSACIEADRATGPNGTNVTRDRLRGCGVSLGASPDPDLVGDWAPPLMTAEATELLNCLATSSAELPNDEWANVDGPNFPASGPTPWPADSCAKLACTSPLKPE